MSECHAIECPEEGYGLALEAKAWAAMRNNCAASQNVAYFRCAFDPIFAIPSTERLAFYAPATTAVRYKNFAADHRISSRTTGMR